MKKKKETLKPSVIFQPGDRRAAIGSAECVLDVALNNQIDLSHSCGGMGSCTTCRVFVEGDLTKLSPRNELEEEIASSRDFAKNERLSCQLEPYDGLVVRIPDQRT